MSAQLVVATLAVIVAAYAVKGATGLGSAIVLVSVGSLFVDPRVMVPVAGGLDIAGGLAVLRTVRGGDIDWRTFALVIPGDVVGTVLGALTLRVVPAAVLRRLIGAVTLGGAAWFLRSRLAGEPGVAVPGRVLSPVAAGVGGTLAGFSGGATGIDGPPIVVTLGRTLHRTRLRATLTAIFLAGDMVRMPAFGAAGVFNARVGVLIAAGIPATIAGAELGRRVFMRVPEAVFTWMVAALLLAATVRLLLP